MDKTDVDGVYSVKPGVLIVDKKSNYNAERMKEVERHRQKDQINILEKKVESIESMLQQILQKVSQ